MNFVDFRISGQNIDLEDITECLNIKPKYLHKKGDTHYDKKSDVTITYAEDCWIANIEIENQNETEKEIIEFIDLFYVNKNYIQQLSQKHDVTLWITLYQDTTQYNLRFSKKILRKISELGIEMDITIMQLEKFYNGQYLAD